MRKLLI
jgi:hypothetical protein